MNSSQPEVMLDADAKASPRGETQVGSGVVSAGIIGWARIAEHHLRYLNATNGVRVVDLADIFGANAERTAKAYGIEPVLASHEQLLQPPSLDAVHIFIRFA